MNCLDHILLPVKFRLTSQGVKLVPCVQRTVVPIVVRRRCRFCLFRQCKFSRSGMSCETDIPYSHSWFQFIESALTRRTTWVTPRQTNIFSILIVAATNGVDTRVGLNPRVPNKKGRVDLVKAVTIETVIRSRFIDSVILKPCLKKKV